MNLLENQFLYGINHGDLWGCQNYIKAYFIKKYEIKEEEIFTFFQNPGVNYSNTLTKAVLNNLMDYQVIIISPYLYKKFFYIFKTLKSYVFLVDYTVYEFNNIEEIEILTIDLEFNNVNFSYEQYCNLNNYQYHEEILMESFKRSSLDWEYLRKNWDFLHWFLPHWLSHVLVTNYYLPWNYIKSLILLIEYFPCLYSFFPEKKVLTCNYMVNMVSYCKK
jgi:hypothetical protein